MRQLFSRFFEKDETRLHFAAHSHHPWPDCTQDAQRQYWEDSNQYADLKWEKVVFPTVIPQVQNHIARILNLSKPQNIAFAPNTHEFVMRLLSCMGKSRPRILTTDSEFYSFDRQIKRLEEDDLVDVVRVHVHPFASFQERFEYEIKNSSQDFDLIYISQVFFNSGFVVPDLKSIIDCAPSPETYIAVDGYHGFMALETDLSALENRIFYLSGGYKYAMSGEGCCFIHVPEGYAPRPRHTGWYAEFGTLGDEKGQTVPYGHDGMRFWGATFDPSGLYRMRSVFDTLEQQGITVTDIHAHVMAMQEIFLSRLDHLNLPHINPDHLLVKDAAQRGHFLTFETPQAAKLQSLLKDNNIITDHRGTRLRFGFGIYHDKDMVQHLIERLHSLLTQKAAS